MISIKIGILDERAGRPTGNPFFVNCVEVISHFESSGIFVIQTCLKIDLPDNLTLSLVPVCKDMVVIGWHMDGEKGLLVSIIAKEAKLQVGVPFAEVHIIEKKMVPVRFIEYLDGKRKICGGPQVAENIDV